MAIIIAFMSTAQAYQRICILIVLPFNAFYIL